MTQYVEKSGIKVADTLVQFIETRALPGTGIAAAAFWDGAAEIFAQFAPENARLLAFRDTLQAQIDAIPAEIWFADPNGTPDHRRHLAKHYAEEIRVELGGW